MYYNKVLLLLKYLISKMSKTEKRPMKLPSKSAKIDTCTFLRKVFCQMAKTIILYPYR